VFSYTKLSFTVTSPSQGQQVKNQMKTVLLLSVYNTQTRYIRYKHTGKDCSFKYNLLTVINL